MPQEAPPTGPAPRVRSLCVYCGSGHGADPAFTEAARALGAALAAAGVRLVYGGGSVGLMGEVARACIAAGGAVTGIIPEFLRDREAMLREAHELIVTADMHERKRLMFERADAFVALPGGVGTLEELVEVLTWAQLGRHAKPVAVLNTGGFWDPLLALLAHMRANRFIREGLEVRALVAREPGEVLALLEAAAPPPSGPAADARVTARM